MTDKPDDKSPRVTDPLNVQMVRTKILSNTEEKTKVTLARKKVVAALWRRGELDWKLEEHQVPVFNRIRKVMETRHSQFVLNASRRWGKTYLLAILAIQYAVTHPNSMILYCGTSQKQVREFIVPAFAEIFKDCPDDILGHYKTQLGMIVFPNGSWIKLTGVDSNRLKRIRGLTCHLVIVDEAGFIDNLSDAVASVLGPTTASTGGSVILSSNAPLSPSHDFVTVFTRAAEAEGMYCKQTIYDVPKYNQQMIERLAINAGGFESSTFKREYLCQFEMSDNNAVVPEWRQGHTECVKELPKPDFFYPMVAADLGYTDFCGVLFGYYDFHRGLIYIEDELLEQKPNSKYLVDLCKAKELELWGASPVHRPHRVWDTSAYTANDIITEHHYNVITVKDKVPPETFVNAVRIRVNNKTLIIHPRCVRLIGQLTDAQWDSSRKNFARDKKNAHFDLIAALMYFVRYCNTTSNPFPENYRMGEMRDTIRGVRFKENRSDAGNAFKKLLSPRSDDSEADMKFKQERNNKMLEIFNKNRFRG